MLKTDSDCQTVISVLDAKWKHCKKMEDVQTSDIYQISSYAIANKISKGILVMPHWGSREEYYEGSMGVQKDLVGLFFVDLLNSSPSFEYLVTIILTR